MHLFGGICLLLIWLLLPDTLAPKHRQRLRPVELLVRFGAIAVERSFITHALQGGFALFGLFAYLSGSPPVYIQMFGLAPEQYGIIFGLCAAGYIGMAQVNARILPRFGFSRVLRTASWLSLAAAGALTIVAFTGTRQLWAVALPIFVFMSSLGFVTPNATIGALARHAAQAGPRPRSWAPCSSCWRQRAACWSACSMTAPPGRWRCSCSPVQSGR